MFRSPAIDRELCMLGQLPAIIRIIDRFFQSTKAKAHTYEQVVVKIAESLKWTLAIAKKHLDYLLTLNLRSDLNNLKIIWLKKENFSNMDYLLVKPDYKLVFLQEQVKARVDYLTRQ